ncbi:DUF3667 domain-containing protein [Sphingomonas sp. Leaf343]|uniref:DUF3667 domain-containing protein n=1 Tax=Sphingomonas sp. Leaf343 TaxID=1736345 RepID=UPI0006FF7962|nr:DUF3667 domain-containing protein [Sphingomonas sp. Leaf343]KQR80464.1 hypothetical protein ASG07_15040 [Sphingomonas sp. Leaf343]
MMGDLAAAAGDVATGALWARAVEPHAGEHADHGGHGGAGGLCLNCGTIRLGDFCHACGQSSHVHRSFGAIGHELAHGVFHFEGKIWRTLPMLFFRPGELTRRYAHGERARFVSPLALFLFIIFVLFTILSIIGAHLEAPQFATGEGKAFQTRLESKYAEQGETIAALTRQRTTATDPARSLFLDRRIAGLKEDQRAVGSTLSVIRREGGSSFEDIHTGWKRLDKGLSKAIENPNLILYKLQSNAYKFAWALIPLSLPFMWSLFPFSRRFTMYDHAVFITYSLCFVSLIGMIVSFGAMAGILAAWLWAAAGIAVPIHMYKQLRGAYGCSRFGAAIRMILLFVGANLALIAFAALLVGLGLVG